MIGPRNIGDKRLVLYGKGCLGRLAAEIFSELKIPYDHIDRNDNLEEWWPKANSIVGICVTTEPFAPIKAVLLKAGYDDIVEIYDIIEAYPEVGIHNGWFTGDITKEDALNCQYIRDKFADFVSELHYRHFSFWHYHRYDVESKHSKAKITIELQESLPSTLADIRKRQHPEKIYIIGGEHPIILHNEGYELETIKQNIDTFRENRPILQVACYHSRDGLWKIPKFLMENLERYRFYFRLHAYQGQGAYIYCIPEEREENELCGS